MSLKFNVFGRDVQVIKADEKWLAYYCGADGKRRPASDIVIPNDVPEAELTQYLGDLCHEWATSANPDVKRL